ncbi:MAG TPA: L,D-transpeptidase, partial [Polyangiales bacterium]
MLALLLLAGCDRAKGASTQAEPHARPAPDAAVPGPDPYADYPLYGLIRGTVVTVRKSADPAAIPLGWLRHGETVRLQPSQDKTPTCSSGWHPVHPRGFVCAGEGIEVTPAAPGAADENRGEAKRDAPLPYQYYLVKDAKVPEFHQVPSRDQQRAAQTYADAWQALMGEGNEKKLQSFLAGQLPGQPTRHAVIRRFLERGYYVASTGVSVRSQRRFAHTVRGSFVKEQQLEAKSGAQFHGVELGKEHSLPLVWAVRTSQPQVVKTAPDGSMRLVDAPGVAPIERLALVPQWKKWARVDGKLMHELSDGSLVLDWYLAVAERIARPKEVGKDEPWVHIDEGEQTLVLYVGDEPKYATLVSSGIKDHKTPLGSFRMQRKYVSDTMSDIGADAADDRYSIDDVPWTQYFDGSRALHAAFWHAQFGIQRSHGCVNLAPADAFYVFQHTWPELPASWHGVSTQKTGLKGSLVVITE